jgi:hypothetical protein
MSNSDLHIALSSRELERVTGGVFDPRDAVKFWDYATRAWIYSVNRAVEANPFVGPFARPFVQAVGKAFDATGRSVAIR